MQASSSQNFIEVRADDGDSEPIVAEHPSHMDPKTHKPRGLQFINNEVPLNPRALVTDSGYAVQYPRGARMRRSLFSTPPSTPPPPNAPTPERRDHPSPKQYTKLECGLMAACTVIIAVGGILLFHRFFPNALGMLGGGASSEGSGERQDFESSLLMRESKKAPTQQQAE